MLRLRFCLTRLQLNFGVRHHTAISFDTDMVCQSCGARLDDSGKACPTCGATIGLRTRKRRESEALADRIANSSRDAGFGQWQRSVIMNVSSGGGVAGVLLVISAVVIATLLFIAAHRLVGQIKHDDGTPYSGGALFYLSVVVPLAVLYFRLAAPLFYRLHVRLTTRRDA